MIKLKNNNKTENINNYVRVCCDQFVFKQKERKNTKEMHETLQLHNHQLLRRLKMFA